jgi:hypothetical protein
MRKFLLSLMVAVAFWIPTHAQAQSVLNPKTLSWTAPVTSVDGSALTDLAGYTIKVRATATGPVLKSLSHPSTTSTPVANTTVTHGSVVSPIYKELLLPDGSYTASVSAVDTALNESPDSVGVPFSSNQVSPSAPQNPLFQ